MSVSMDHMNIFFTFQKHKLASNDSAIKKEKNTKKAQDRMQRWKNIVIP